MLFFKKKITRKETVFIINNNKRSSSLFLSLVLMAGTSSHRRRNRPCRRYPRTSSKASAPSIPLWGEVRSAVHKHENFPSSPSYLDKQAFGGGRGVGSISSDVLRNLGQADFLERRLDLFSLSLSFFLSFFFSRLSSATFDVRRRRCHRRRGRRSASLPRPLSRSSENVFRRTSFTFD